MNTFRIVASSVAFVLSACRKNQSDDPHFGSTPIPGGDVHSATAPPRPAPSPAPATANRSGNKIDVAAFISSYDPATVSMDALGDVVACLKRGDDDNGLLLLELIPQGTAYDSIRGALKARLAAECPEKLYAASLTESDVEFHSTLLALGRYSPPDTVVRILKSAIQDPAYFEFHKFSSVAGMARELAAREPSAALPLLREMASDETRPGEHGDLIQYIAEGLARGGEYSGLSALEKLPTTVLPPVEFWRGIGFCLTVPETQENPNVDPVKCLRAMQSSVSRPGIMAEIVTGYINTEFRMNLNRTLNMINDEPPGLIKDSMAYAAAMWLHRIHPTAAQSWIDTIKNHELKVQAETQSGQ